MDISHMTNDEYMAISGSRMAAQDIADGRRGYHRDACVSPAYRDAYDSLVVANFHRCSSEKSTTYR